MKSYIKSSFLMVILMALFAVGFSNANAKTPTNDETTTKTVKVETFDTAPRPCKMRANNSSNAQPASSCEPSSTNLPSGQYIVTPDCHLLLIKDGEVTVLI